MFHILEAMTRWLAPILSFTSEEIWRFMPGARSESVFFNTWLELPKDLVQKPSLDWDAILNVRGGISRELEKLRNAGSIGGPLDSEVDVYCKSPLLETLQSFGEELRFVFITSDARVHSADRRPAEAAAVDEGEGNTAWVVVKPTAAVKCVRCWHKRADVGSDARHPELCARCVSNVEGSGEQRRFT
jgi:isoleucyl-tRNA synthetase